MLVVLSLLVTIELLGRMSRDWLLPFVSRSHLHDIEMRLKIESLMHFSNSTAIEIVATVWLRRGFCLCHLVL